MIVLDKQTEIDIKAVRDIRVEMTISTTNGHGMRTQQTVTMTIEQATELGIEISKTVKDIVFSSSMMSGEDE